MITYFSMILMLISISRAASFVVVGIPAQNLHQRRNHQMMGQGFVFTSKQSPNPVLILISGCTGTGKSTFGMSIALNHGILKCISTDTVRQVLRGFDDSPALHRSSYSGNEDPIIQWRECCDVLDKSIDSLVDDAISRGVSLVVEGVHVVPSNKLIDKWRASGGRAVGCLLTIEDEHSHRQLIFKRGELTKKGSSKQQSAFDRIRVIQVEMKRLAQVNNWVQIEQQLGPSPTDIINEALDIKFGSHVL